ncbi:hypothetical protein GCM10009609_07280 [Pseudonocardia aurantiaca]
MRPYIDRAAELFGVDRLMYGGDWPVSELAGGYPRVWAEISAATAAWTDAERDRLYRTTAIEVYRLSALTT